MFYIKAVLCEGKDKRLTSNWTKWVIYLCLCNWDGKTKHLDFINQTVLQKVSYSIEWKLRKGCFFAKTF